VICEGCNRSGNVAARGYEREGPKLAWEGRAGLSGEGEQSDYIPKRNHEDRSSKEKKKYFVKIFAD
jgi:hypothetical protein